MHTKNAMFLAIVLCAPACGGDDAADTRADAVAPTNAVATADTGAGGEPAGPYTTNAAQIEIVYDGFEIPHIYAADEADAFHGAGYAQAVDRLFALEMSRRAARGTLSELLGEAGFTGDLQARTFEFGRLGEESLQALAVESPRDHRTLEAFATGINRRLAEIARGEAPMPPELVALGAVPAPFTAADLMANGMRVLFGFSNTLEYDLLYTVLQRLVADTDTLPIFQHVTPLSIMAQGDHGAPKVRQPRARTRGGSPPAGRHRAIPDRSRRG
jgi:penicillin amidase